MLIISFLNSPQIFLHREDITCLHEPFDEAFYFGPERLHPRYEGREDARIESGYSDVTYEMVVENIREHAKKVCSRCFTGHSFRASKWQPLILLRVYMTKAC